MSRGVPELGVAKKEAIADRPDADEVSLDGVTELYEEGRKLLAGVGTNSETDLYWRSGQPVWTSDGDTVIVTATDRTVVLEESY